MTAALADPVAKSAGPRLLFGEPLRRLIGFSVVFAALAVAMVSLAVHKTPQISPLDEATHADYAYQVSHFHIPGKGSVIAPEILREWSCHGFFPSGDPKAMKLYASLACGTDHPAKLYPASGDNYNYGHPPLYYAITGFITRALNGVDTGPHFITIARLVGIGWLLAAMIVLYLAARKFGARWPFAFGAAAILPFIPTVLSSVSIVTNDAPASLSGTLAAYLLARIVVDRNYGWIAPTVWAFLITATKVLNVVPLLAVGVVVLVMAVGAWRLGDRARFWALARIVIGIAVAFAVVYLGWQAFQSGRGVPGWKNPILHITGRDIHGDPLDELLSTVVSGFGLGSGGFALTTNDAGYQWLTQWDQLSSWLLVSAPLAAIVAVRKFSPTWKVGATALGVIAAFPLIVELQVYLSNKLYFATVTPRYGMTIIPVCLLCVAVVASRRNAWRSCALVGALGALAMLVTLLGSPT